MRLVVVAGADSPHTRRWLGQLRGLGWDIHLVSAYEGGVEAGLRDVTVYSWLAPMERSYRPDGLSSSVRLVSLSNFDWRWPRDSVQASDLLHRVRWLPSPAERLARLLQRLRPDVVHSLEMQHAAYLTLAARRLCADFPPWIYSCWGSDLYWFGRLAEHRPRIAAVLAGCDYLMADCERDVALARRHGFAGEVLGVFPGPGGFDCDGMQALGGAVPPSRRRRLAVKGYDDERGRGCVALRAVERCADLLGDYEICVYMPAEAASELAADIVRRTALRIRLLPAVPVEEIWRLLGGCRVAISLSLSDGTPNTMLEAMTMGAFPLQSSTPGIESWLDDGRTGALVAGDDVEQAAAALRSALTDDALVDAAAEANDALVRRRISLDVVRPRVLDAYERALRAGGARGASPTPSVSSAGSAGPWN